MYRSLAMYLRLICCFEVFCVLAFYIRNGGGFSGEKSARTVCMAINQQQVFGALTH